MVTKADYTVTLDATQDRSLQSLDGLVKKLGEMLQMLQASGTEVPRAVDVIVIYPDAEMAEDLELSIDKLNKVIEPKGFMDKIAHSAFRSMSGVEGNLHPIAVVQESDSPPTLRLSLDLSGISQPDVAKFAEFLSKNAHRLA